MNTCLTMQINSDLMRDGVYNPVANVWREAESLEQAKCYGRDTMPRPAQEYPYLDLDVGIEIRILVSEFRCF